jgi:hypothetical protein
MSSFDALADFRMETMSPLSLVGRKTLVRLSPEPFLELARSHDFSAHPEEQSAVWWLASLNSLLFLERKKFSCSRLNAITP